MDWGKIMIGIGLVMLSAGMLVSPSGAAMCDRSCIVGCGNAFSPANAMVNSYSLLQQGILYNFAGIPIMGAHHNTSLSLAPVHP